MASENIKSIYETSNKNDKAMKETAGLESKLNHFRWIKKKYLNKLGDSLGQISYFKKKIHSPEQCQSSDAARKSTYGVTPFPVWNTWIKSRRWSDAHPIREKLNISKSKRTSEENSLSHNISHRNEKYYLETRKVQQTYGWI